MPGLKCPGCGFESYVEGDPYGTPFINWCPRCGYTSRIIEKIKEMLLDDGYINLSEHDLVEDSWNIIMERGGERSVSGLRLCNTRYHNSEDQRDEDLIP